MNARGDRTIVTYRDERIATAVPADPDCGGGVPPMPFSPTTAIRILCGRSVRRPAGAISRWCSTVIGRQSRTIRCFASPRTLFFPPNVCAPRPALQILRRGCSVLRGRPKHFLPSAMGQMTSSIMDDGAIRQLPVFEIKAVDTLGAGDTFHGGFVLAIAEGRGVVEAMRFGSAVAGDQVYEAGRSNRLSDAGRSRGFPGAPAGAGRAKVHLIWNIFLYR